MEIDPTPTQLRRLAANIYSAAGRMRELLAVTRATCGNRSTYVAAAAEAASRASPSPSSLPAVTKGSNNRSRMPRGIPGPVSSTSISAQLHASFAAICGRIPEEGARFIIHLPLLIGDQVL